MKFYKIVFLEKLINEIALSTTHILSRDKVMYANIKSELKFVVDENGNFTSIEYIGSLDNQTILKKIFWTILKIIR